MSEVIVRDVADSVVLCQAFVDDGEVWTLCGSEAGGEVDTGARWAGPDALSSWHR